MAADALSAGILAGGQSRRFGNDKAWTLIEGVPVIERLVAALRAQSVDVLISGRAPLARYARLGCTVVDDQLGAGPLAGVHSLLAMVRSDWLLVLPVDLVAIPGDWVVLWRALLSEAPPGCRALILEDADGRWQPVHCLLHRSLRTAVAEALLAKELGLGDFLRTVPARPIRLPAPASFNTRAELALACAQSASAQSASALSSCA